MYQYLELHRGAIFKRLVVVAAWHSITWHGERQQAWERMADHKGVYDASHLLVANACTGTRMLARSCWMSATMLFLYNPKRDTHGGPRSSTGVSNV